MQKAADIRAIVQPIMRLAFAIEKSADRTLRGELDMGFSQVRMLLVIRRVGAARQRDIADFWGVAEASVSRQIAMLARRGLVARRANPGNRRERMIELTAEGVAMTARATKIMGRELERRFSAVRPKDRAAAAEGLNRLLAAFQGCCPESHGGGTGGGKRGGH